ncbi:MAG: ATP-binding protein, partial [Alphaproteobacteria bacterium]
GRRDEDSGADLVVLALPDGVAPDIEEKRVQSQKMELVGQLAGGIAHDFNNLLAAIMGNLELLGDHLDDDGKAVNFSARALSAANRGAALTQRLLAFSRRQDLRPVAVDINQLVAGMDDLLARSLGASVALKSVAGPDLWLCEIDPGQMENAILNLCINARDAMPHGGQLRIETANFQLSPTNAAGLETMRPGDYVRLAISDTGVGMTEGEVNQAFEPFFTTKDVGRGSGLGLSMVYGFAKQSGGMARIISEPGVGTTVEILLPRTAAVVEVAAEEDTADAVAQNAKGEEVILVVEDDEGLRAVVTLFLGTLGYQVRAAEHAHAALAEIRQGQRIDLMLTDIVLPGGMDGTELVERVRRERPKIKFLYMSGFTSKTSSTPGQLEDGVQILMKPFANAELAAKIRQILATE